MKLAARIKQYYFENVGKLPEDKQFHYATRIAAWDGDARAFELLRQLRSFVVPDSSQDALTAMLQEMIAKPQSGRRNAHDLRRPFFEEFPQLYGLHSALFRTRHLISVYGVDARPSLFACSSKQELDDLADKLLKNAEALRVLSTFAINFFYLYTGVVLGRLDDIGPNRFIEVSKGYDLSDKVQLQLLIYLFTHCVIGETNFYTAEIKNRRLTPYIEMLSTLEEVIDTNFDDINLDNKLEFLVCCRLCGTESKLASRIYAECKDSISNDGHFLVDRHNSNPQASKSSFASSEHRNVLFIMSSSAYSPHSTLV